MLLTIIIPTKNEEKNINRLLVSIFNNENFNKDIVEVVVIDNPGTTDRTREIVNEFECKLAIIGPERSSQRNYGAEIASGEYIYFVDADMEFTKGLLLEIIQNLNQNKILVVKERVPGNSLYCKSLNIEKQLYDYNTKLSAARVFHKKSFLDLGGFNTEMISGEDWELDKRFVSNGFETCYLESHILHHEEDIGIVKSIKKKIYYAKNLKNYKIGIQTEVNPLYRYKILFSKPKLFLANPLAYSYLILIKTLHFTVGAFVFFLSKFQI
jgi:glycosyltransferase involved in cell wall biosynthesis